MQFLGKQLTISEKTCHNCTQNQALIDKYQKLITLLNKKAHKSQTSSQLSVANKHSIDDKTTSNASFNGNAVRQNKMYLVTHLVELENIIKNSGFMQIKAESYFIRCKKGMEFLKKIQVFQKNTLLKHFQTMKRYTIDDERIILSEEHHSNNSKSSKAKHSNKDKFELPQKFENILRSPLLDKIQENLKHQNLTSPLDERSQCSVNIDFSNSLSRDHNGSLKFSKKNNFEVRNLLKKIFILEQENLSFVEKIKNLDLQMQDALNRQIKDNRKKTESLEMVAEEMQEKNEMIIDLQQRIAMLEDRHNYETNGILEDELTTLKRQVQKMDKTNVKLDNDLRKEKEKVASLEAEKSSFETESKELERATALYKQEIFEMGNKIVAFEQKQNSLDHSCVKVDGLLEKLKYLSKMNKCKERTTPNLENLEESVKYISEIEDSYKLELTFIYLYNIENEDFQLNQDGMFDEEEFQVLTQLKYKMKKLKRDLQVKIELQEPISPKFLKKNEKSLKKDKSKEYSQGNSSKSERQHEENHRDIDITDLSVYGHEKLVDASIFEVLNEKAVNRQQYEGESENKALRVEPQKNFTMKLLQMELQKNKQIQKISELKEKIMHIRIIILNLIKSLELKLPIKNETAGTLDVIFDVFEYSQEEKEAIFHCQKPKQRRLFGFI